MLGYNHSGLQAANVNDCIMFLLMHHDYIMEMKAKLVGFEILFIFHMK